MQLTADEFYRLRDDRTVKALARGLRVDARIAIGIDPAIASELPSQVAFVLAVNLTARWARNIRIGSVQGLADPLLTRGDRQTLSQYALQIARAADPFGD